MKIAVVGGGPAGLYAGLLISKSFPHHKVVLFEKNAPDATYGWGVVFSDRTLTSFREADYKSYVDIVDNFVMWDSIDIRYRSEVVRCGGQVFSGIARKKLLGLLQARCANVGVEMRFADEAAGPDELDDYDLIVAADGVHSVFRSMHEDVFQPELTPGTSKYIWFGTPHPFDSFTFVFRSTDHGLFQAHAYPYDGEMSTFIAECDTQTWHNAGLDAANETESIAFCEKLFDEDLAGSPLMSNNSSWISFVTVKNKTWRHGNIALMGDAAHTAHFSIGSGTKLAMEDAIALANSLQTHDDLDAALADYELERRPRVVRFQEAARQSQSYFENTSRYTHLEPVQFAFHLLTRSGRIDYDNLRMRDPGFVASVDRHFSAGRPVVAPPPAFTALSLSDAAIPNRVAVAQSPRDRSTDGIVDEETTDEAAALARGGYGIVMTEPLAVSAPGRVTPASSGLYDEAHARAWARATTLVHDSGGSLVAAKLSHSGIRGSTRPRHTGLDVPLGDGWRPIGPTERPYATGEPKPLAMDRAAMDGVVGEFAASARRARETGFDLLVVDMAGGSLLASWLSPLVNDRSDEYGSSESNRLRYPLELFDAVRAEWPEGRPLGVALVAHDWAQGGLVPSDGVSIARALKARGCDFVEVRAGHTVSAFRPRYDPYFLVSYSDTIRNEAGVPTIATGQITSVDEVNTIVGGGRADLCLLQA